MSLKYQIGISIKDAPVTDARVAQAAIEQFGWSGLEPEDASMGLWLVHLDAATRRALRRNGHIERSTGTIDISAEMP